MGGPGLAPSWPSAFMKPLGAAPESISANANALLSFSRSDVRTTSKSGKHELNVASDDLRRPPVGSLMAPLETLNETSGFGLRVSPLTGTAGEFHWGQDFAAACGTRVYAADAGVVRAVGWHPWGGGNRVEIDHGNGLITTYNHLEGIAVKKGDSVQVGEVIAKVGTTGSSTGCHLHFETILNGVHADPLKWTLLPIKQLDELGNIDMISYAPGTNAPAGDPTWAIPVSADNSHTVTGGETEAPVAGTPSATASGTPSATASGTPSATATGTPSAPATGTPSAPATGTPSASATGTPSAPATQNAVVHRDCDAERFPNNTGKPDDGHAAVGFCRIVCAANTHPDGDRRAHCHPDSHTDPHVRTGRDLRTGANSRAEYGTGTAAHAGSRAAAQRHDHHRSRGSPGAHRQPAGHDADGYSHSHSVT